MRKTQNFADRDVNDVSVDGVKYTGKETRIIASRKARHEVTKDLTMYAQFGFEVNEKFPWEVRARFLDHDLLTLVPIDKSVAIIEAREIGQEFYDKP